MQALWASRVCLCSSVSPSSSSPELAAKSIALASVGGGAWLAVFAVVAVAAWAVAFPLIAGLWAAEFTDMGVAASASVVPGTAVAAVGAGTAVLTDGAAVGVATALLTAIGAAASADVGSTFLGGLLMPKSRCRPCLVISPKSSLLLGSTGLA